MPDPFKVDVSPGADAGIETDDSGLGDAAADPFAASEDDRGDLIQTHATARSPRSPRSPVRDTGRVRTIEFDMPPGVVQALDVWLAGPLGGRPAETGQTLRDAEFAEQMHRFLEDVVARDMYADRARPESEKRYDFSAWAGVEFADLIDDQAVAIADQSRIETVAQIAERLRILHPELAEHEILTIVGILGEGQPHASSSVRTGARSGERSDRAGGDGSAQRPAPERARSVAGRPARPERGGAGRDAGRSEGGERPGRGEAFPEPDPTQA